MKSLLVGCEIDYAQFAKFYGKVPESEKGHSAGKCISAENHIMQGQPDNTAISTSYAEHQNLTMRL
jgi:hypothetical protein